METITNGNSTFEVYARAGNNLFLRRVSDGCYIIAHGWRGEGKGWDAGKYFGSGSEDGRKANDMFFKEYTNPDSYGYK